MYHSNYIYHHGELELHGYVAYNEQDDNPKPAVLVIHDWSGQNEFARQKAMIFAELGYVGFAIDMYGSGKNGETITEKEALMHPLMHDRLLLRTRVQAALDAVITMPEVDHKKIAVIGYCFGGLCALDLARSGAEIKGAISVHGLLEKPADLPSLDIQAKILVLHGAEDTLTPPSVVTSFCDDMTAKNVDWQLHVFGKTQHAFTNPQAHDTKLGLIYSATAARRSTQLISNFLEEILG